MNWTALIVFILLFAFVTVLGFVAARWRRGDLDLLHEWGLAGRRFGTVVTWFLLGGDLYTAYTFIAVPALVYGSGAIGFFALPYTIIAYPLVFLVMPRLWNVCRRHAYVTPSDFVRGRYGSHVLALVVALTGILATMPYIALQLVGIEVVLAAMGITGTGLTADLPLIIAFVILAAYTYFSGLRAPALIALVKDALIYITVIVAIIAVPMYIARTTGHGSSVVDGYTALFSAVPKAKLFLSPLASSKAGYFAFATLALGSAFALFMYPHSITGVLSSNSGRAIKRNAALLPAYSFLLGLIALFGYMALVAGVKPVLPYGAQYAVPGLFIKVFPSWFQGFAFAAIAIGALVPASIMSIAAAKTFPAIVFGLYTRWFHRWALLAGWAVGMLLGTYMAYIQTSTTNPHFASSTYILHLPIGGGAFAGYAALYAFIANLIVATVLSLLFNAMKVSNGRDTTAATDYEEQLVAVGVAS